MLTLMEKSHRKPQAKGGSNKELPPGFGKLNTNIDPEIRAAMDAYIAHTEANEEHPASIRSTVEIALKRYLGEKGFGPLAGPDPEG